MATPVVAPGLDALATHFGLSLVDSDGNPVTCEEAEEAQKEEEQAEEDKESNEPSPPVGSLPSFTSIYQGEPDSEGRMTWSADEPKNVPEAAENEKTIGHAIIIRNGKSQDSRKKYEVHSLVIQSPHLKRALSTVFEGYPGVSCDLTRLIFDAPFKPFVHRWSRLMAYMEKPDNEPVMREHLQLLHSVLIAQLGETIKALEDYVQHGIVTFQHLWCVFAPSSVIVAPSSFRQTEALEVRYGDYVKTQCGLVFSISTRYIDFDGENFGWDARSVTISKFEGTREISSLRVVPIQFLPQAEVVRESLVQRGQTFESLAGRQYKSYSDSAIELVEDRRTGDEKEKIIHVNGRIVVDADSWNTHSPHESVEISPIPRVEAATNDIESDADSFDHVSASASETDEGKKSFQKLTDYQRLLATSLVRGYSLKLKKWLKFKLDAVEDIKWSSNAFENLVLPAQHKELVLALAQTQVGGGNAFDDVIAGKGRGMILLLTGPPGVGKTLTAESTAEHMRVPLFMMGAGDLGTDADEVEANLNNILTLVASWKAILLIDECDVFLEARSVHDLERNKLVSIFLRLLEYYEGILFLTTNRVSNMDAAFQSRIHITIDYAELEPESRVRIWNNFLRDIKYQTEFSKRDVEQLSHLELNGRQIKNILKASQLLAVSKKEPFMKRHVDVILAIEKWRPSNA
ncbi:uncharacterized protein HMPREF1541_05523 [Cyphellophora europaea CBS 101466]|uniref:AAA+ ATPase domain-containing protein n=1 Tax=Cyphellophora europaea (strain CBS 101466) TaxID=1220924 RepID=W2RSL0_CYPE1|nr:uncharacterized protein HMPREF1541_05523 [Cyphellophora europaea CBS 101466]ETN39300.1 hypothetical protein HMPREF1541_05523 [Cyphellophora europaea CBS 101466]